jgi:DNA ligase 1
MQETLKELSDFLPSWVSQEQITDLLMSSKGDIVKAASNFFERERYFFEEANVSCTNTEKKHSSNHGSSTDVSSQQESPLFSQKLMEYSAKLVNLSPMRIEPNTPKKANKRGSSNTNKPKKKGRLTSSTESGGRKQYTITNYFIRATEAAFKRCRSERVTVEAQWFFTSTEC